MYNLPNLFFPNLLFLYYNRYRRLLYQEQRLQNLIETEEAYE